MWNLFIYSFIDWHCHHYNLNNSFFFYFKKLFVTLLPNFWPTLLLLPNVHWHTRGQRKISLTFSNSCNLKTISLFSMPFSWTILETSYFKCISKSLTEEDSNLKKNGAQKCQRFLNHLVLWWWFSIHCHVHTPGLYLYLLCSKCRHNGIDIRHTHTHTHTKQKQKQ